MPLDLARALHDQRYSEVRTFIEEHLRFWSRFTLEIGSGHGHFLTAYAEQHPERRFLGIDIIEDRLDRSRRKSGRADLKNVLWLRAEAGLFLEALAALRAGESSEHPLIEETIVLFPDPWPKRRHWKNRLVQPEFLDGLASVCADGARLCFRTDHPPYFEAAQRTLATHPLWMPARDPAWPFELSTVFQQRAETYQSCIFERRSSSH